MSFFNEFDVDEGATNGNVADNDQPNLWYIVLIEYIVLLIPVYLFMRRYASFKKTPFYTYGSVYFGWYVAMMIVLLIPIDITSSSYANCIERYTSGSGSISASGSMTETSALNTLNELLDSDEDESQILAHICKKPIIYIPPVFSVVMWNLLYWISFVMCWAIYPLMQNYSTAGDFTFLEKMKTSIRENAWFYIAMGVVGLVFLLIYLVIAHTINPIPVCMALANAWGLGLVIITLGYGMVTIPKKVWKKSFDRKELMRAYFDVSQNKKKLIKARDDLLKNLRLLKSYDTYIPKTDPFRKYVDIIVSEAPPAYKLDGMSCSTTDPLLEYDKLVSLHYNLMFYDHEYKLCNDMFISSVKKVYKLEDILRAKDDGYHLINWTLNRRNIPTLFKNIQWIWYCILRGPFLKVFAIILSLLSLMILWCECTFFVDKPVLSVLALMISPEEIQASDVYLTLTIFVPLLYIVVCSYWSLFQLRIFRYYRLIPNQNTDCNSLLFSAAYLSRLAPPLALNFIHILKLKGTSFQKTMSSMEKIPILGDALFNQYAPIALVIVCAFFLFDVIGRVLKCCKISWFYYEDSEQSERGIEDGKAIMEAERRIWTNGVRADTSENDFSADIEANYSVPDEASSKKKPKILRLFSSKKPEKLEQASLTSQAGSSPVPPPPSSSSPAPYVSPSSSSSITPSTSPTLGGDNVTIVHKKHPTFTREDLARKSRRYEQLNVGNNDYDTEEAEEDMSKSIPEPKLNRRSGWKQLSPSPSADNDSGSKQKKGGWRKLN